MRMSRRSGHSPVDGLVNHSWREGKLPTLVAERINTTTTVTSQSGTVASTSTRVVYTAATTSLEAVGADGSTPLAYLGLLSSFMRQAVEPDFHSSLGLKCGLKAFLCERVAPETATGNPCQACSGQERQTRSYRTRVLDMATITSRSRWNEALLSDKAAGG